MGKELGASPLAGKPGGACMTDYPAKGGSQEEVASYYEKELDAHGWKVKQHSSSTEASRNGLRYVVRYLAHPRSMEVEAQVYKDE